MTFKHILIPTDGSEASQRAIATGVALAAEEHAKVTGLYVTGIASLATIEISLHQFQRELAQTQMTAQRNLGEIEQAAREAGVECQTYCDDEHRSVPDAIARITQQSHCDLVVMGTNGRRGLAALLNPSNAKAVARHVEVPVLVVHEESKTFKTILVPTDGSDRAQKAVRAAVEFARDEHAKIIGFYPLSVDEFQSPMRAPDWLSARGDFEREMVERKRQHREHALHYLEDVSRRAGVPCETHVNLTRDSPHEAIVHEAEKDHCDLIFMAADAQRGLAGWFADSESTKVMTTAKMPVMLYQH